MVVPYGFFFLYKFRSRRVASGRSSSSNLCLLQSVYISASTHVYIHTYVMQILPEELFWFGRRGKTQSHSFLGLFHSKCDIASTLLIGWVRCHWHSREWEREEPEKRKISVGVLVWKANDGGGILSSTVRVDVG